MLPPLSLAHTQIGQGEPVCAKLKEELVWLCINLLSTLRVARCYQQVQAYSSLQSLCTFCIGELDNQLKTQYPMGPGLPGFKLHSLFPPTQPEIAQATSVFQFSHLWNERTWPHLTYKPVARAEWSFCHRYIHDTRVSEFNISTKNTSYSQLIRHMFETSIKWTHWCSTEQCMFLNQWRQVSGRGGCLSHTHSAPV